MPRSLSRRERLEATCAGAPVDRVAVALWRHFPGDDQRADDLASATLAWQREWDWDFVKVSPASSFCLVDWGAQDRWVGGDEGNREYTRRAIASPDGWARLGELAPQDGRLGEQLHCLEGIRAGLGVEVPFIQTIFSPLAQARNLAGAERLAIDIRTHPELVLTALEVITRTTEAFVREALRAGAAGIYYAVQMASYGVLSEAEYRRFGEPYDRRVLAAAQDGWFNMAHLHGANGMFDLVAAYPVRALNWHDRESGPSLAEGQRRFPGAVSGGLEHWDDLLRGEPDQVARRVEDAIAQTGGKRLIVSSGCVAPVNAPLSNLRAVRRAVGA
jgi:uroporphyrinogen decarboxylase